MEKIENWYGRDYTTRERVQAARYFLDAYEDALISTDREEKTADIVTELKRQMKNAREWSTYGKVPQGEFYGDMLSLIVSHIRYDPRFFVRDYLRTPLIIPKIERANMARVIFENACQSKELNEKDALFCLAYGIARVSGIDHKIIEQLNMHLFDRVNCLTGRWRVKTIGDEINPVSSPWFVLILLEYIYPGSRYFVGEGKFEMDCAEEIKERSLLLRDIYFRSRPDTAKKWFVEAYENTANLVGLRSSETDDLIAYWIEGI